MLSYYYIPMEHSDHSTRQHSNVDSSKSSSSSNRDQNVCSEELHLMSTAGTSESELNLNKASLVSLSSSTHSLPSNSITKNQEKDAYYGYPRDSTSALSEPPVHYHPNKKRIIEGQLVPPGTTYGSSLTAGMSSKDKFTPAVESDLASSGGDGYHSSKNHVSDDADFDLSDGTTLKRKGTSQLLSADAEPATTAKSDSSQATKTASQELTKGEKLASKEDLAALSQLEKKRHREKKRRSDITHAIDELGKVLVSIDKNNLILQNNLIFPTTPKGRGSSNTFSSLTRPQRLVSAAQPFNRTEIINYATRLLQDLFHDNEAKNMQLHNMNNNNNNNNNNYTRMLQSNNSSVLSDWGGGFGSNPQQSTSGHSNSLASSNMMISSHSSSHGSMPLPDTHAGGTMSMNPSQYQQMPYHHPSQSPNFTPSLSQMISSQHHQPNSISRTPGGPSPNFFQHFQYQQGNPDEGRDNHGYYDNSNDNWYNNNNNKNM